MDDRYLDDWARQAESHEPKAKKEQLRGEIEQQIHDYKKAGGVITRDRNADLDLMEWSRLWRERNKKDMKWI